MHTSPLWSSLPPRLRRVPPPRLLPLLFLCPLISPHRCFLPTCTSTSPTQLVIILLRPLFPSDCDDESFRNSDPIGQPAPRVPAVVSRPHMSIPRPRSSARRIPDKSSSHVTASPSRTTRFQSRLSSSPPPLNPRHRTFSSLQSHSRSPPSSCLMMYIASIPI